MTMQRSGPTLIQLELLARQALASLPEPFGSALREVVLGVADFATAEQLASVGLEDRWELTGLYEGHALTEQSSWDSGTLPPRIWLFREPLIAEWRDTGVNMDDLVRHVVIHEAGHHFGYSDEDMHRLEEED